MSRLGRPVLDELVNGGTLGFGVPCGVDLDGRKEVGRVGFQFAGFEVQDAVENVDAVEGRRVPEHWRAVSVPGEDVVDPGGSPFVLHGVGEDAPELVGGGDVSSEV